MCAKKPAACAGSKNGAKTAAGQNSTLFRPFYAAQIGKSSLRLAVLCARIWLLLKSIMYVWLFFCSHPHRNGDSVLFLTDQPQPCQSPGVLGARGDQVNPGRLNTGVAQDVRQLGHVPADTVERPGEQVPQIVGKHLAGCHARLVAQRSSPPRSAGGRCLFRFW